MKVAGLKFRPADALRDNESLCHLARLCPQGSRLRFYHERQDFWERCRHFSEFQVTVAERNNRIVAVGCLGYKDVWLAGQRCRVGYLFDRMVHPAYRRQGIGLALLEHQLQTGSPVAVHYALVLADNRANRRVLERAGFIALPYPIRYFVLLPDAGDRMQDRNALQVREPVAAEHAFLIDRKLRPEYAFMDDTRDCGMASVVLSENGLVAGGIVHRPGLKGLVRVPWYLRWAAFGYRRLPALGSKVRLWLLGHVWYADRQALRDFLRGLQRLAAQAQADGVLLPVAANDRRLPDFRQFSLRSWGLPQPQVSVYVRGPQALRLLEADLPVLPSLRDG